MKLTDAKLRSLKASDKTQKFSDGGGLYIHVSTAGGKLWRLGYRFDGKQKTLALGKYPDVGLSDARRLRDEARAMLAQGIDPAAHKREAKAAIVAEQTAQALTFEVVSREWFAKKTGNLSEGYRGQILARLEYNVFPHIGGMPIASLKSANILSVVQPIEQRGANETARRVLQYIGRICRYGRVVGYVEFDATAGLNEALSPRAEVRHHAAIIDPVELGHLLRAIDAYRGEPSVCYALRLIPYVFLRSVELRGARWAEIDLEAALWNVPAERMKMKRPHVVPLAPQVVKLFQSIREYSGNGELVFPGMASSSKSITGDAMRLALRRMGFSKDEMSIHGFRSTASTLLNEQGYRPDVIEAQLAHAEQNAIRDAYNRAEYMPERCAMMETWADYLDQLREQAAQQSAGKVKP